jgi:hypothetical protein
LCRDWIHADGGAYNPIVIRNIFHDGRVGSNDYPVANPDFTDNNRRNSDIDVVADDGAAS